ncbi:MAG: AmmeMemoRadiSam system protein B [Chitinivibrionia bacterium]|nr:AmmeMemoRadiSam system protein B [Chitinivibrionia bacterium]
MKYLGELREHEEKPVLLKYMNSGDTAGDKSRVVGYAAMALFEDPNAYKPQE